MNLKCWHHWLYLGFNYDSTTHTLMMYSDKKKKKTSMRKSDSMKHRHRAKSLGKL